METQLIADLIPKSYQEEIKYEMLKPTGSKFFPWYLNHSTIDSSKTYDSTHTGKLEDPYIDSSQFYHMFLNTDGGQHSTPYFHLVRPILYFLESKFGVTCNELIRVKGNLLVSNGKPGVHVPHIDNQEEGYKTLLYYVNSSDGDTITYNEYFNDKKQETFTIEKTITPTQGSAILLDTNRFHTSSMPVTNEHRCVINFIFKGDL